MKNVIDLMGKTVSFIDSVIVDKKIYSTPVSGTVTQVVLDLNGDHEISINHGDLYKLSDVLEFQVA